MKHSLLAAALLLAAFGGHATGADASLSTQFPDISMTDTRCQLTSSNSNVDYGPQSRWQMQDVEGRSQSVTPGKRQLSVSVVCPFTHEMRLKVMGSGNAHGGFRFGENGEVQVRVIGAQLDGEEVQIAPANPAGTPIGSPQSSLTLSPNETFSAVSGNQPAQGKAFNVRLEIQPVLTDKDARVSSRQANDASLSFEFID